VISSHSSNVSNSLISAQTTLNIIVVEEAADIGSTTVEALSRLGHTVHSVSAKLLDDELILFRPDLLILELEHPFEDGLSLIRHMRAARPDIGIVILTARSRIDDKIAGYNGGADLYLTKPVSIETLGAAIQALARRIRLLAVENCRITLIPASLQLVGPHASIDVSSLECALLCALAEVAEHPLGYCSLIKLSGKGTDETSKATLEVQIVRLRKKLEKAGAKSPTIKSIRSVGYQLCEPLNICLPNLSSSNHHA